MTIDRMVPTSLDDIYGPGAEDALGGTETTYTVRVNDGRTVEMTGMQEDLDQILAAMQATATEAAERLTGIDYVLGTEEHRAVGSLDLLNLMHPETAGIAMYQAIERVWPAADQDRLDLLNLAAEYLVGQTISSSRSFLFAFSTRTSKHGPAIWSALIGAQAARELRETSS